MDKKGTRGIISYSLNMHSAPYLLAALIAGVIICASFKGEAQYQVCKDRPDFSISVCEEGKPDNTDPNYICVGSRVYFKDVTDCFVYGHEWDFGDGNQNDINPNCSHIYNYTGYFYVELFLKISVSEIPPLFEYRDTNRLIRVVERPVSDFNPLYLGDSNCAPVTICFDNTSLHAQSGDLLINGTHYNLNECITFEQPGYYDVNQIVYTVSPTVNTCCYDTKTVTLKVGDITPPVITPSADITLECPADITPATTGEAIATDNCPNVTINFTDNSTGGCGNTLTILRTWTATDASGNSATAVQTITVADNTAPVITPPADVTLECPADTRVVSTGEATGTDTCGEVLITHSDKTTEDCGGTMVITRTWMATDECGNEASAVQTITVADNTAPVITPPADVTLECPLDTSPGTIGEAVATDTCSSVTISYVDLSTSDYNGKTIIRRKWTAKDECSNTSTATQTLTVRGKPVIDNGTSCQMIDSDTNVCAPVRIECTAAVSEDTESTLWEFGDGNTSGQSTITHTFYSQGQYIVSLTASNVCGDNYYDKTFEICSGPEPAFEIVYQDIDPQYPDMPRCLPVTAVFFNTSQNLCDTDYLWDFGDGSPGVTDPNVIHTYTEAGEYIITLTASNECGSLSTQRTIIIEPEIMPVDFDYSPQNPCVGSGIVFTVDDLNEEDLSMLYTWDFGDSNSTDTTDRTITHTYFESGDYDVRLIGQNICSTVEVIKTITVYEEPDASFMVIQNGNDGNTFWLPQTGPSVTVSFQNTSNSPPDTIYLWNFGDTNEILADQNSIVKHPYTEEGTFKVSLTAQNLCGQYETDPNDPNKMVNIIKRGIDVSFIHDQNAICESSQVLFTNTSQNPPGDIEYIWGFEDGNDALINPNLTLTYTFMTEGGYDVTLTAHNPVSGEKFTFTSRITVMAKPLISFFADTNHGLLPFQAKFHCLCENADPNTILWAFGDGNTSRGMSPTHRYQKKFAYYNVSITVSNICGDTTIRKDHLITIDDCIGSHPKITKTTPNKASMSGGEWIEVQGECFTEDTQISFIYDRNDLTGEWLNPNILGGKIRYQTPQWDYSCDHVNVTAKEPDESVIYDTYPFDFYGPPPGITSIEFVNPNQSYGSSYGGEEVIIRGSNFKATGNKSTLTDPVFFGKNMASIITRENDWIRCVTPSSDKAGPVDVKLRVCEQEATLYNGFTYTQPMHMYTGKISSHKDIALLVRWQDYILQTFSIDKGEGDFGILLPNIENLNPDYYDITAYIDGNLLMSARMDSKGIDKNSITYSQNKKPVYGWVRDTRNNPIEWAKVYLLNDPQTYAYSREDGRYTLYIKGDPNDTLIAQAIAKEHEPSGGRDISKDPDFLLYKQTQIQASFTANGYGVGVDIWTTPESLIGATNEIKIIKLTGAAQEEDITGTFIYNNLLYNRNIPSTENEEITLKIIADSTDDHNIYNKYSTERIVTFNKTTLTTGYTMHIKGGSESVRIKTSYDRDQFIRITVLPATIEADITLEVISDKNKIAIADPNLCNRSPIIIGLSINTTDYDYVEIALPYDPNCITNTSCTASQNLDLNKQTLAFKLGNVFINHFESLGDLSDPEKTHLNSIAPDDIIIAYHDDKDGYNYVLFRTKILSYFSVGKEGRTISPAEGGGGGGCFIKSSD